MSELHAYAIYVIFGGVIVCIVFNLIDMVLAALLGLCALTVLGIVTQKDVINTVIASQGSLALLFGGMVVARVLTPTGIFKNVGIRFLRINRGSGKRFLLMMVVMVSAVCAILPNATAVILLAPIIIRVCRELNINFVGPMIFTSILSNSAGLLTLVGDPATFMVGQAMGLTLGEYLNKVSPGGVLAIFVLIPLMPLLLREAWQARTTLPADLRLNPIERPGFCIFAVVVLVIMVSLFLIGESIPHPIVPPAAAIIGASLALLAIHTAEIEPIENVLRDVDWKTIIFIFYMMCYVEQITKTGILAGLSRQMFEMFEGNLLVAGMFLLASIGIASGFLANIPVVAAAILMTKGYLVLLQMVPEEALGIGFTAWPDEALPVFVAMMFGGTLGGNATLIGASANLVAVGICASQGSKIDFVTFLRYGVPVTICQLAASAVYVWVLTL